MLIGLYSFEKKKKNFRAHYIRRYCESNALYFPIVFNYCSSNKKFFFTNSIVKGIEQMNHNCRIINVIFVVIKVLRVESFICRSKFIL